MNLIAAVNIEENFWKLNPELKYMSPFNKLMEGDESPNKEMSSKLMWAVYLYCDPESRFARMAEDDRKKEIAENYLQLDKEIWESEDFITIVRGYEEKVLTKLQKSFNRLLKKLEERDLFISKTPYNENNAKKLDDMFANSSKIYQQLLEIENELSSEKKAGNIKGGRKESLSEQKKI